MDNVTINLQLGEDVREVEVYFNYEPATPAEGLHPGSKEQFEIVSIWDVDAVCWLIHESDIGNLIEVISDHLIEKIKEQL